MIKAILCDNDGVLVDTEKIFFEACREIYEGTGHNLSQDTFIEISLKQGRSVFETLSQKGYTREQILKLRDVRNSRYSELLRLGVPARRGIENILRELHNQYRMAIVTSSRKDHFDLIHQQTGFLKYFVDVLTPEDYTQFKPNAEPYLKALQRLNIKPEEAIVIEDSERGLASARGAGIPCLIFPHEFTQDFKFPGAAKIIHDPEEILSFLDESK